MDFFVIIFQAFKPFWWLIPIALVAGILKTPWFKGVIGETLVKLVAKLRLPAEVYHPLHNVTLPTPDGTTQIDHIFVSRYGIFVVETKNMKGWIFGDENQAQWTQKIYRQSIRFQNPLRQNYKHLKALETALDVPEGVIHSVIAFMGDSRFKTEMPANVTSGGGYVSYIKSFRDPVLSDAQVQEVIGAIEAGRLAPSRATHRQHVAQLKSRSNPEADRKCPKCGSHMLLRTVKKGSNGGNQFWGCSTYPSCKVMQKLM